MLLHQVVHGVDWRVLGRVALTLASLNAVHHVVSVDVVEESHGNTSIGAACIEWRHDNSVWSANPLVVGPPAHQVAQIDDKAVWNLLHRHPLATSVLHLQTRNTAVLPQNRQ